MKLTIALLPLLTALASSLSIPTELQDLTKREEPICTPCAIWQCNVVRQWFPGCSINCPTYEWCMKDRGCESELPGKKRSVSPETTLTKRFDVLQKREWSCPHACWFETCESEREIRGESGYASCLIAYGGCTDV
ncbi:hypothetical protein BJ508DRAFT_309062 [Ascobolus immersus RN42]|uniref:PSI domain-containing protein n=1 Tax=Ascobolus immersus RN42 TaxID=1160509 RepID=A0A3N4I397_ASCIM|nr:hypothetical protein BJ508DRAFT_309062 [Ascobolus immersus RN42]